MVHSLYLPRPQPEPFRAVAIVVSIALNAAVFMLLMQPPSSRARPEPADTHPNVDPIQAKPAPITRPRNPVKVPIRQTTYNPPLRAATRTDPFSVIAISYPAGIPAGTTMNMPA